LAITVLAALAGAELATDVQRSGMDWRLLQRKSEGGGVLFYSSIYTK